MTKRFWDVRCERGGGRLCWKCRPTIYFCFVLLFSSDPEVMKSFALKFVLGRQIVTERKLRNPGHRLGLVDFGGAGFSGVREL